MKIIIANRFSFFGKSGWKSQDSAELERLHAPKRLERRFALFEQLTLPSLAAQTNPDFIFYCLSSRLLPDIYKVRLKDLLKKYLPGRHRLVFGHGLARAHLFSFMERYAPGETLVTVPLDDDDGLAIDYIENLRNTIKNTPAAQDESAYPFFITYPLGYGLSLRGEADACDVYVHRYPFINLGLAMIGKKEHGNIFSVAHQSVSNRYKFLVVPDTRMFVRSLHDTNDSRVEVTDRWVLLPPDLYQDELKARFPYFLDALEKGGFSGTWSRPDLDMERDHL